MPRTARSSQRADLGDEDPECDNCDGTGWTIWYTNVRGDDGKFYAAAIFVGCPDCNDGPDEKPYPAPWPVCVLCEESAIFSRCGPVLVN